MPSWVKYNETLTATEIYEERYVRPLLNESDIYVISSWETKKTYVLKHLTISDDMNLLVLSTRHSYLNAVITRLNFKSYYNINGNINLPDHKRVVCQIESLHQITNNCKCAELWDWAKKMTSLPIENWKSASLICYLRKDVQGIVCALKTDFSELRIKEYHGELDLEEKARDFNNVEVSWKDLDLIAYTSTLKIGVSYTNPKFEQNSVFLIAL
ncbi:3688_t:CDS:2 [Funneliformis geosporum]|nr:3688_t:CDS:2 [Funneliformis geosporum]